MIKRYTVIFENEYYADSEDDAFDKQMSDINDQAGSRGNWQIYAKEDAPMCETCKDNQVDDINEVECDECLDDD